MTLMREPKKYDAGRGAVGAYLSASPGESGMKHLERLPARAVLEAYNGKGFERASSVNAFTPVHWPSTGAQPAVRAAGTGAARGSFVKRWFCRRTRGTELRGKPPG